MQFSEVLASITDVPEGQTVTVTQDWAQGRATFGGLIAAIGSAVMRRGVPADRPLRSLQTAFVAPAGAGEWTVRSRILRVGRAVTLTSCEIIAPSGEIIATQTGVYGSARDSGVRIVAPSASQLPQPDHFNDSVPPHGAPKFLQHFAIRWTTDAALFSGTRVPSKAYLRHVDPAPTSEAHVVALADCLPTPALFMLRGPAPASSLVWSLEFLEHDLWFDSGNWWRIDTEIDAAADGYVHQTGMLYDPRGRTVALTRQVVTVYG